MLDLEAEYNNRARVPEHPAIIAGWQRDAAAFRATQPNAQLAVSYGPTERQRMDIFWPNPQRHAPLAMFWHGGYWQALDRGDFSHLAAGLVAHGVAVAMPSYDLCPYVTLSEIVAQARRAARFLHGRTGAKLLGMGHSAGGHLAAMAMAQETDAVPAMLAISGLFDLAPLVPTSINGALKLSVTEAVALSPVKLPRPAHRGLLAVVGAEESGEYHRQTRAIAEAWGGAHETAPGNHFTVLAPLADPASALVAAALRLLPAAPPPA